MRLDRLRQKMADQGLDGMLITDSLNRRYLTGFTGSSGFALVTAERAMLAVDFRYYEQAERESPAWEQVHVEHVYFETLGEMVAEVGVKRLGFEADHVTVAQFEELQERVAGVELCPTKKMVLSMRMIKDEQEVELIRAAVNCADEAFAHLQQVIHPGMREVDVAWELESYMRQHGATATSFSIIVGSGPNGAMPHATTGERVIGEGEPIVIDFGAVVEGYCSDITRTICLGHADERYMEVWNLVLAAQRTAEEQLRPGMTNKEADALAREVIKQAGYDKEFGHGLGHGVGLAIHESPGISQNAEEVTLEPGMVFTVEPGVYLPGWGGVRIEDIVVMRQGGVEVLTRAPKEPVLVV